MQNFTLVLSGTGINILVQLLVSPMLTRLYGPEAYGVFSVFNAVCTNLALIATLRLPQALLLPKEDETFYSLVRISLLSALGVSLLVFVALIFFGGPLLSFFNAGQLLPYYYVIPVMVLLISANQVMGQWQYRLQAFRMSVVLDTGTLVSVRLFNLIFGWLSHGMMYGLILGDVFGKTAGLLLSGWLIIKRKFREVFEPIPADKLKAALVAYRQYPLFNLPGVWFTTFSDQLAVFFISATFGLTSLGTFSLAVSMLDLPKRLLAYTASSVFYRRAVELQQTDPQRLKPFVLRIMYIFLALSVLPYGLLAMVGPELFQFVFGKDWLVSGEIASLFSFYCVLELLFFSLDSVFYVLRQEKKLFFFQMLTFVLRLVALWIGTATANHLIHALVFLAVANSLLYAVQLAYMLHVLGLVWWKHMLRIVGGIVVVFGAIAGVYHLITSMG